MQPNYQPAATVNGVNYPVPHDATMWVDQFEGVVYYKWQRDGQLYGYKVSLRAFVETSWYGSPYPTYVQTLPIQAPPPPEPASIFATRKLTEDELLDPALFCRSTYEPILEKMLNA